MTIYDLTSAIDLRIDQRVDIQVKEATVISVTPAFAKVQVIGSKQTQKAYYDIRNPVSAGNSCVIVRPKTSALWIIVSSFSKTGNRETGGDQEYQLSPPSGFTVTNTLLGMVTASWNTPPQQDVTWQVQKNSLAQESGATDYIYTRGSYAIIPANSITYVRVRAVNSAFQSSSWTDWASATPVADGTVTSVGLTVPSIFTAGSAVTTSGNLSFTLNSQTANKFLGSPDGAPGTPTFRALVIADLPALNYVPLAGGTMTGTLEIDVATATHTGLILKSTDDSLTDPALAVKSSAGAVKSRLRADGAAQFSGHLAVGNGADINTDNLIYGSSVDYPIISSENVTDLSATYAGSWLNILYLNPSAPVSSSVYGFDFEIYTDGGNSQNFPYLSAGYMFIGHGGSGDVSFGMGGLILGVANYGSGDPGAMQGLSVGVSHTGAGAAGDMTGIRIDASRSGAGSALNVLGLDIGNVSGGGSGNYAIRTGTGIVHLGDLVELPYQATPSTPATNYVRIYPKSDGHIYALDWLGNESDLSSVTAGAINLAGGSGSVINTLPQGNGGTGLASYTDGDLIVANTSGNLVKFPIGTNNYILTVNTAGNPKLAWVAPGAGSGVGTVTSVDLVLPSIFTVSGNPIISSGTLTATFNTQSANLIFASPGSGSPAAPTFRTQVLADLPQGATSGLPLLAQGSGTAPVYAALDISTAAVTGTLPTAKGGTGQTSYTAGDILVVNNTPSLAKLALGSNGYILTVDTSSNPKIKWAAAPASGATISKAAFASRPGSPASGDLFLPTDSYQLERYNGASWDAWGPLYKFTVPPLLANWTWVNQGSITTTETADALTMHCPVDGGSDKMRYIYRTRPGTTFTVIAHIIPLTWNTNYGYVMMGFRESSSGKVEYMGYGAGAGQYQFAVDRWNSATSYSTTLTTTQAFRVCPRWWKIQDDGTNRKYYISEDGQNWLLFYSVTRTTFITADQIVFGVYRNDGTNPAEFTLASWAESSP